MRTLTRLFAPAALAVTAACYGPLVPLDEPTESLFGDTPSNTLPIVEVDAAWLESVSSLPADELFDAAGLELGVPAALLESLALTETAFATDVRWLMPDDERVAEAAAISLLDEELIRSDRAAHVAAGAARLRSLAIDGGASLDDEFIDSGWWVPAAAFGALDEPWLADAYAGDVFAALQMGFIAATPSVTELEQPDVIVVQPHEVPSLGGLAVLGPPDDAHMLAEYPGADGLLAAGGLPRGEGITRIELDPTNGSWAGSLGDLLAAGEAHYLVRRRDGAVTQLLPEGRAASMGDDGSLRVALAATPDGFGAWTPQLLEGAARLTAYLAWRHDVPVSPSSIGGDLGPHFPVAPWLEMVGCFVDGGGDACATGLAGSPGEYVAPPSDDEGRSEARSVSVPYFYQYANSYHPSASCQNTSIAMVLKWAGWSGTPDDITARFGKDLAQSPAGLAQVFNTLADEAGLDVRITPNTSGSLEGLRSLLAAGKPTIVHGYFTGYGHVMVATGYDGSGYTANDPAGKWAQSFKGGYPYGWSTSVGRGIRYGKGAFEQAVSTSNGSSYLPLWYHELTGGPSTGGSDDPPPADDPPPGDDPGDAGSGSDDSSGSGGDPGDAYPWASISFLEPTDGQVAGDPLLLRARREGGHTIKFWSDSYLLASSTDNPGSALVDIFTHGERNLRAQNVSAWGTVLANHDIRVTVEETGELTPLVTNMGENTFLLGAETTISEIAFVTYHVDGWLLTDDVSGSAHATGAGFPLQYTFSGTGEDRTLIARGYSVGGDLLAEGTKLIDVEFAPAADCLVAGFIECGRVIEGDTSVEASDVINGYPDIVGNYDGPEVGYRFVPTSSGEVEFRFIDPEPALYDQDIFLLEMGFGSCTAGDVLERGFNSLTVEVSAGAQYVVVVDGFSGAQGAFRLELDCNP